VNDVPFNQASYKKYVIDKNHSNSWSYRALNGNTNSYTTLNNHDDLEQIENKTISISSGLYTESFTIQQNSATLIVIENLGAASGPHLGVSTSALDFGAYNNTMTFSIYNYGDEPLSWNIYENPEQSWISSITPANGVLNSTESKQISVSIDRLGLNDGSYNGTLTVSSNGGDEDIAIFMHVGTPELPQSYFINAGGNSFTDNQSNVWLSDRAYSPGSFGYEGGMTSSTNDQIFRTDDDPLYQTERYDLSAYRFDVPNGDYQVTLHLAEIYFESPNERQMNVAIEDELKISNLDIYNEVGHDVALSYTFSHIPVTDGRVDITFSASSRVPKISAIEVINMDLVDPNFDSDPPQPPQNIQITTP